MHLKKLVLTAMLIALAFLLAQVVKVIPIPMAGAVFLPMHIPVLLAGLLLGARYGFLAGLLSPIVAMLLTGLPMLMPIGLSMIAELATYGAVAGYLAHSKQLPTIVSLLAAMIVGRLVYGAAATILFGIVNMPFGFDAFISAAITTAIPGIIIQLIAIPVIIFALKKRNTVQSFSVNA